MRGLFFYIYIWFGLLVVVCVLFLGCLFSCFLVVFACWFACLLFWRAWFLFVVFIWFD